MSTVRVEHEANPQQEGPLVHDGPILVDPIEGDEKQPQPQPAVAPPQEQPLQQGQGQGQVQAVPQPPRPVGVLQEFVAKQQTTLVVKQERSWSGSDYSVKTLDGQTVLETNGKTMSYSDRVEFKSMRGELIFTLRKRNFNIPPAWYLEDRHGTEILEVKSKWAFSLKMDVTFRNTLSGGEPVLWEIRGNWTDRKADILYKGYPVARVRRSLWNSREFTGRHTYGIECAAGIDIALVAAIVIGIDQKVKRKGRNAGWAAAAGAGAGA